MLLLCCEETQISCENCHFPNRAVNVKKYIYIVYTKEQILVCSNLSFLNIFVTFSIKRLNCTIVVHFFVHFHIKIKDWQQKQLTTDTRQSTLGNQRPTVQQQKTNKNNRQYSMCDKIKLFSLISTN
jgi:hypothetical protein